MKFFKLIRVTSPILLLIFNLFFINPLAFGAGEQSICDQAAAASITNCKEAQSAISAASSTQMPTSSCPAGHVSGSSAPGCTVSESAQKMNTSADAASLANQKSAAACSEAKSNCTTTCQQSVQDHEKAIQVASASSGDPNSRAKIETEQKGIIADRKNIEKCNGEIGFQIAGLNIQGWQLGLAAAAAGGVLLLTQSGKSKGSSSGTSTSSTGTTGTTAETTNNSTATAYEKGTDTISIAQTSSGVNSYTNISQFANLSEMNEYWNLNSCEDIVYGNLTTSPNSSITSTTQSLCKEIANNSTFSGTLLSLGSCSDMSGHNQSECFDRVNNYCLNVSSETRLDDRVCKGFCYQNPKADACSSVVANNPSNNNNNTSDNPFYLKSNSTSSSSNAFSSLNSFTGTSTNESSLNNGTSTQAGTPFNESTATTTTNNPQFKSFQLKNKQRTISSTQTTKKSDCSDPELTFTQECVAPMTQYCSRYGSKGTGCPLFCTKHTQVCVSTSKY